MDSNECRGSFTPLKLSIENEVHPGTRTQKPLLVSAVKRYLSVQKDVKLCPRVVGLVPGVSKSQVSSDEILILIFSRACCSSPSTFL